MIKQITPEVKQRIFALYWMQKIMGTNGHPAYGNHDLLNKGLPFIEVDLYEDIDDRLLEINPLSSILFDDCIECVNILNSFWEGEKTFNISEFREALFDLKGIMYMPYPIVDLLRSKGYALPAFGYSVDELIEANVFVIKKEVENV